MAHARRPRRAHDGGKAVEINHVGVSGGKDSAATLLWMLHDSGYDRSTIRASFTDTGNEHPLTLAYVEYLSREVFPIEVLHPTKSFLELAKAKQRFPSARARFCTTFLKMEPSRLHVQQWLEAGDEVLLHAGVRRDESDARKGLAMQAYDPYYDCDVLRPIIDWNTEQVFAYLEKHGVRRNPLYEMGMERVGCYPCIFSRKSEVRVIAEHFPERIDELRGWEKAVAEVSSRGAATFFAPSKVPRMQRSGEYTTKDGNTVYLAMIDDVVRWSRTDKGGVQGMLFGDEELEEATFSCPSMLGMCE